MTDDLATRGYSILKGVLTRAEVRRLTEQVDGYFRRNRIDSRLGVAKANAVAEAPELVWIFTHPGILEAVRASLESESLVLVDNGFSKNIINGWHKDVGFGWFEDGGYFGCDPFGRDDCRVHKIAIYLEDHRTDGSGLTVRVGSHRTAALNQGDVERIHTDAGDVVIFDARLTHRGQDHHRLRRYMHDLRSRAPKLLGRSIPPDLLLRELECIAETYFYMRPKVRRGVFFAYGAASERTSLYARRCLLREQRNDPDFRPAVPRGVLEELRSNNITILTELP
jgi:hypothetical protein